MLVSDPAVRKVDITVSYPILRRREAPPLKRILPSLGKHRGGQGDRQNRRREPRVVHRGAGREGPCRRVRRRGRAVRRERGGVRVLRRLGPDVRFRDTAHCAGEDLRRVHGPLHEEGRKHHEPNGQPYAPSAAFFILLDSRPWPHVAKCFHVVALNPKSTMGTVISHRQLERIEALVHRGVGTILAGGKRMTGTSTLDGYDFSRGAFFPPTVITSVPTEDDLWREEIFGPVVVVTRFSVRFCFPSLSAGSGTGADMTLHHDLARLAAIVSSVAFCFRVTGRAWSSPTRANTGWVRAFGRRTCRRHTGSPQRSRLASCGLTRTTAMIPAHHGS